MAEINESQKTSQKTEEGNAENAQAGETFQPAEQVTPRWDCSLGVDKPLTVGQTTSLTCTGFDDVTFSSKNYSFKNNKKDPYLLKILNVKQDQSNIKEFEVTSYRVSEGPVLFTLVTENDEEVFNSGLQNLKVNTVIQNKADSKPTPPSGFLYRTFSMEEFILIGILVAAALGSVIYRVFRKVSVKKDFKRVLNSVKYDDPFLDLNIDLNHLSRNQKEVSDFEKELELLLKKFFYKIFNKPVFFQNTSAFSKELKRMQVENHDLRAVGLVKRDYEKIMDNQINSFEDKKEFLDQAKKNLNRLKKYYIKQQGSD